MGQPLPDPHWTELPEVCFACGYSLAGLAAPGRCPECGARFERGCLTLAGVPRYSTTSPLRRAAWVVLLIVTVVYTWIFPLLALLLWWAALLGAAIIVLGMVWFYKSSPRERSGSERFLVTPGGVVRIPIVISDAELTQHSVLVPWGAADTVELRRVLPNWRRLRIGPGIHPGELPLTQVIFDAGIRCGDDAEAEVRRTIESLMAMARCGAPPVAAAGAEAATPRGL